MTDAQTVTVRIPLVFRKRGGRKTVVTPDGEMWETQSPLVDGALIKALARAFRWRRLLDDGVYATFEGLARAEGVSQSHVSRMLRLTLLSPDLIERMLTGQQPEGMRLEGLLAGFPEEWRCQRDCASAGLP